MMRGNEFREGGWYRSRKGAKNWHLVVDIYGRTACKRTLSERSATADYRRTGFRCPACKATLPPEPEPDEHVPEPAPRPNIWEIV